MKHLLFFLTLTCLSLFALAGTDPDGEGNNHHGPGFPEVAQMGQVLELAKFFSASSGEISKLSENGSPEGDEDAQSALNNNREMNTRVLHFLDVVEDEQDTPQNTAAAELDLKQAFDTAMKTKGKIKLEDGDMKLYQQEFVKVDEAMSEIVKYYK